MRGRGLTHHNNRTPVIGVGIDPTTWTEAVQSIASWSKDRQSRVVCLSNVHAVVTARLDPEFSKVVEEADMAAPDGAPIAFMLRKLGFPSQERIDGPGLMWRYCAHAAASGDAIYLYGGQESTLAALQQRLASEFPELRIAGAYSPPFRALTPEEDDAVVQAINDSEADVVWVSLGCPKQEKWMAAHRGRINAVMVGVGAAFNYHGGTLSRAPLWMQRNGLEWLHRLVMSPGQLWKRYLVTNTLFIVYAARQLVSKRSKRLVSVELRSR
jgi:N-acetylglucosaminyldiphosphoundecaprenol N-acetyl-beta-D-mannosaminyltransferase